MNENRRRTARYISDQHIMEKAMDRAKVKNLEAVSDLHTLRFHISSGGRDVVRIHFSRELACPS